MNKIKKIIFNKKGAGGLNPFIVNIVLILVFSALLIFFIVGYVGSQNPNSDILTNSEYGLQTTATQLNDSFNNISAVAKFQASNLSSASPSPGQYIFLIFIQGFYVPLAFLGSMLQVITFIPRLLLAWAGVFGPSVDIVINLITVAMTVTMIFLLIKNIRTGESENY